MSEPTIVAPSPGVDTAVAICTRPAKRGSQRSQCGGVCRGNVRVTSGKHHCVIDTTGHLPHVGSLQRSHRARHQFVVEVAVAQQAQRPSAPCVHLAVFCDEYETRCQNSLERWGVRVAPGVTGDGCAMAVAESCFFHIRDSKLTRHLCEESMS